MSATPSPAKRFLPHPVPKHHEAPRAAAPEPMADRFMLAADRCAGHILNHLHTVQPHKEDLDIAYNRVENAAMLDGSVVAAPDGRVSILAGATATLRVRARPGYTMHLAGYKVGLDDPAVALSGLAISLEVSGQVLAATPVKSFKRPVTVDLEDQAVLRITNTTGGTLAVSYELLGWLRRQASNVNAYPRGATL